MASIKDWKNSSAGAVNVNWSAAENKLGFKLHNNLKDFYSGVLGENNRFRYARGYVVFEPEKFVKEYVNKKDWLVDANSDSNEAEITLFPLKQTDNEYVCDFFENAFFGDWTGGNDFGHRAYIGELYINIGQILIVLNNDTGRFEWVDFGYGYFDVYEENPYGIIADTVEEFFDKLVPVD